MSNTYKPLVQTGSKELCAPCHMGKGSPGQATPKTSIKNIKR